MRRGKGHTCLEIRSSSGVQTVSKHSLLRPEKKGGSTAHFWRNPSADIMRPRLCVSAPLTSEWVRLKCSPEERQWMCDLLTTIRVRVDWAVATDHCAFSFTLRTTSQYEKDEWMIVCCVFVSNWRIQWELINIQHRLYSVYLRVFISAANLFLLIKALDQFRERKRKPEMFDVLLGTEPKPET